MSEVVVGDFGGQQWAALPGRIRECARQLGFTDEQAARLAGFMTEACKELQTAGSVTLRLVPADPAEDQSAWLTRQLQQWSEAYQQASLRMLFSAFIAALDIAGRRDRR